MLNTNRQQPSASSSKESPFPIQCPHLDLLSALTTVSYTPGTDRQPSSIDSSPSISRDFRIYQTERLIMLLGDIDDDNLPGVVHLGAARPIPGA